MSNKIQLLPDHVANQIAAGEVIQRPASVVKELLENAIDAGATHIKLIVEEAGKTKIQVIDNGCGMTSTDARMCFERHATSKIKNADDLFNLFTKGFRGEALASIAAIAHVDLKTKRCDDEVGCQLEMEGSTLIQEEEVAAQDGTSFSVKNLFFNVPARRKFLKSNNIENKHIIEEFQRVALAHPDIKFEYISNGSEVFNLEKGSFRQRIVGVFGKSYNERLVPIDEETNIVKISGFIGKPENAKKSRGEQFFFVNNRFIKSNYLQHAVTASYDELLPSGTFPSFFIKLDVDPNTVDINIHPTKTEIKFEEEKSIYAIIRSAVKQALGKYNIAPSLDFDQESSFDQFSHIDPDRPIAPPEIKVDKSYNPFQSSQPKESKSYGDSSYTFKSSSIQQGRAEQDWESFFNDLEEEGQITVDYNDDEKNSKLFEDEGLSKNLFFQIQGGFIITQMKGGLGIIDQHHAHERILYEEFIESLEKNTASTQQLLFPENIELTPSDFIVFQEIMEDLNTIGFDIREFGKNAIAVYGTPAELQDENYKQIIDRLIEHINNNPGWLKVDAKDKIAAHLAHLGAISRTKNLSEEEMEHLVARLFQCTQPQFTPNGKPTMVNHSINDLKKKFQH